MCVTNITNRDLLFHKRDSRIFGNTWVFDKLYSSSKNDYPVSQIFHSSKFPFFKNEYLIYLLVHFKRAFNPWTPHDLKLVTKRNLMACCLMRWCVQSNWRKKIDQKIPLQFSLKCSRSSMYKEFQSKLCNHLLNFVLDLAIEFKNETSILLRINIKS